MKIKEIQSDEEFIHKGHIFILTTENDKVKFKYVRKHNGGKAKKVFTSPSVVEVMAYFIQKGYLETAAEKFYEYYDAAEWKDSNGKQILNWKQKAVGIWFKDENKTVDKKTNENTQMVR